MSGPSDLPEAAERRLHEGAFSSGLSVNDFAACLEMGLEPVGLVQGFCAMQSSNFGGGLMRGGLSPYGGGNQGGYVQNYQCPHGFISNEHRAWGQNYEETWVENGWNEGFTSAYSRMLEEAQRDRRARDRRRHRHRECDERSRHHRVSPAWHCGQARRRTRAIDATLDDIPGWTASGEDL